MRALGCIWIFEDFHSLHTATFMEKSKMMKRLIWGTDFSHSFQITVAHTIFSLFPQKDEQFLNMLFFHGRYAKWIIHFGLNGHSIVLP